MKTEGVKTEIQNNIKKTKMAKDREKRREGNDTTQKVKWRYKGWQRGDRDRMSCVVTVVHSGKETEMKDEMIKLEDVVSDSLIKRRRLESKKLINSKRSLIKS